MFGNNNNNTLGGSSTGGLFGGQQQPQQQLQQQQIIAQSNQNPYGSGALFNNLNNVLVNPVVPVPEKPIATPIKDVEKKKVSLVAAYRLSPKPLFSTSESIIGKPKGAIGVSNVSDSAVEQVIKDSAELKAISNAETDKLILSNPLFSRSKKLTKLLIQKNQESNLLSEGPNDKSQNISLKADLPSQVSSDTFLTAKKDEIEKPEKTSKIDSIKPLTTPPPAAEDEKKSGFINNMGEEKNVDNEIDIKETTREETPFLPDGYFTIPSFKELSSYEPEKLISVKNFTVGKNGIGQVEFVYPVDLTTIPLSSIGDLIVFEKKQCVVYPDVSTKPKVGEGFNVPAIISLEGCYPSTKDRKGIITDPKHPAVVRHINKLKSVPNTQYLGYEANTGTWKFKVEHF